MYLNIAFTILYIVEAGLKFIALRLVSFFFLLCIWSCFWYQEALNKLELVSGKTFVRSYGNYLQVYLSSEEVSRLPIAHLYCFHTSTETCFK